MSFVVRRLWPALPVLLALGCASSSGAPAAAPTLTDAEAKQSIVTGMHDSILVDIDALVAASEEIARLAPTPSGRGWDAAADAAAITQMRAAWTRARTAYEHIEGAVAPLFPDLDLVLDARYDDFLGELKSKGGDADLFDDQGVTGLHAVERILWSDSIPARVVEFEKAQPGYLPAAYPKTEQEAVAFKTKLCARVVADAKSLRAQWVPQRIDLGGAFQGLVSLMNEQREKVNKASTNTEESRYSQRTMADIRGNLEGTQKIYALFQPWLASKQSADATKDGKATDAAIADGFRKLGALYAGTTGDAIPQPPTSWSAESPSPADLESPFGKLYTGVKAAADPDAKGSIVGEMNRAADILGFPEFKAGQ
ncbi:MAG: EfeM/EfeO family lipoprotein [Polyangiaceae bacterium]|nr:EfeM/EfeO family lipoprotein [Polyangiaceae bacterium]